MESEKAYKIIHAFADKIFSKKDNETVVQWFLSSIDQKEKDEAWHRIWTKQSDNDEENTKKSLLIFWKRVRRENLNYKMDLTGRWLLRIACFILPFIVSIGIWKYAEQYFYKQNQLSEFNVKEQNTGKIILSDGTAVMLNASSTLLYPNKFSRMASSRKVFLIGEGNFSVAKNKQQPFIVQTSDLSVEATGTKFNVKSYSDAEKVLVTLEKGGVKVKSTVDSVFLRPGQQVCYNRREHRMKTVNVNSNRFNAWVNGYSIFYHEPLNEIISDMSRKFDVKFVVDRKINTNRIYSMTFRHQEKLDYMLSVLSTISGNIKYNIKGNTVLLKYEERNFRDGN